MKGKKPIDLRRRQLLRRILDTMTYAAYGSSYLGVWGHLTQARASELPSYELDNGAPVPRIVLIFLEGGWNSHFSIDPVFDTRLSSGNFQDIFATHTLKAPISKPKLLTGIGFQNALPAFNAIPTAFVNGLNVEIAAHDAAENYILTGKSAIGRALVEPSFPAVIATTRGGLASHLVLGGSLPLGDTIYKSPPLLSSGSALGELLTPAGGGDLQDDTRALFDQSLAANDQLFFDSLGEKSKESLHPFRDSQKDVAAAFQNFAGKLNLSDDQKSRYKVDSDSNLAHFPAALLALKYDLTTIVTIRKGGFDTHTNEVNSQIPTQQTISEAINTFVLDLIATPDPRDPAKSLADTTTIIVTSEFCRTPKFNETAGTDHQNSASALIMGRGVKDQALIGGTDEKGKPLGWDGEKTVEKKDTTMIDGATLVATIMENFNLKTEADSVSPRRIRGLFS